jgi:hypothetical protein
VIFKKGDILLLHQTLASSVETSKPLRKEIPIRAIFRAVVSPVIGPAIISIKARGGGGNLNFSSGNTSAQAARIGVVNLDSLMAAASFKQTEASLIIDS